MIDSLREGNRVLRDPLGGLSSASSAITSLHEVIFRETAKR
jgi:hypothetical protein